MKNTNRFVLSAIAAGLVMGAATAGAYEPGQFIGRVGLATVDPREDSDDDSVGLNSNTQLGLTLTYMFAVHLGVELLAATPFKHDIYLRGTGIDAGTTKHLPPTVSLQYYPMDAKSKLQPYVGLGLNYTMFFSEDVSSDLKTALETNDVDLSLDDSTGLAAEIGVDYEIANNWSINAAVWWIDIDTTADLEVNGETAAEIDVSIDPWVYMVSAAYAF